MQQHGLSFSRIPKLLKYWPQYFVVEVLFPSGPTNPTKQHCRLPSRYNGYLQHMQRPRKWYLPQEVGNSHSLAAAGIENMWLAACCQNILGRQKSARCVGSSFNLESYIYCIKCTDNVYCSRRISQYIADCNGYNGLMRLIKQYTANISVLCQRDRNRNKSNKRSNPKVDIP